MKTSYFVASKMFVLSVILLLSARSIKAQYYLLNSNGLSSFYDNIGNLGIGTTNTSAKLHIYSGNGFSTSPLLKTEIFNSINGQRATVQHCLSVGGTSYGVYQTSSSGGSQVRNYFQDPVKVGYIEMRNGLNNTAVFGLDPVATQLDFVMNPGFPFSDPLTPLTINVNGITVRTHLITDYFQLTTGAGANKILVSDNSGNGIWTNINNISDTAWRYNRNFLYTNALRVGIGTSMPSQKLEICHTDSTGGIVINQISNDSNIIKSEIKFSRSSKEKFAIGYGDIDKRHSFYIWNHIRQRTALFIDAQNGMTGVDTDWPVAKFDINGDLHVKDKVGIGCTPPTSDLYKLFVEGGIEARDIKVTIDNFPDYCFEKHYDLMSIYDLDKFVTSNKHLPGIPSAKEVETNKGFEVGDLQVKLIKTIEEQALYIIDLQKQIDELKNVVSEFSKK